MNSESYHIFKKFPVFIKVPIVEDNVVSKMVIII